MKAVIFDMDGVLIDSEMRYIDLYLDFFREEGYVTSRDELQILIGSPKEVDDEFLLKKTGTDGQRMMIKRHEFFDRHPLDYSKILKENAYELLNKLKDKGIKIALASSSRMDLIKKVLKQCNIEPYFNCVLSGEMFAKSKPDPEIYNETCKRLGIDKKDILVVEDSPYGIEAAKSAGLKVVGIVNKEYKVDISKADYIVNSLEEINSFI